MRGSDLQRHREKASKSGLPHVTKTQAVEAFKKRDTDIPYLGCPHQLKKNVIHLSVLVSAFTITY